MVAGEIITPAQTH